MKHKTYKSQIIKISTGEVHDCCCSEYVEPNHVFGNIMYDELTDGFLSTDELYRIVCDTDELELDTFAVWSQRFSKISGSMIFKKVCSW